MVRYVGLQCAIVVFPGRTRFIFKVYLSNEFPSGPRVWVFDAPLTFKGCHNFLSLHMFNTKQHFLLCLTIFHE